MYQAQCVVVAAVVSFHFMIYRLNLHMRKKHFCFFNEVQVLFYHTPLYAVYFTIWARKKKYRGGTEK